VRVVIAISGSIPSALPAISRGVALRVCVGDLGEARCGDYGWREQRQSAGLLAGGSTVLGHTRFVPDCL